MPDKKLRGILRVSEADKVTLNCFWFDHLNLSPLCGQSHSRVCTAYMHGIILVEQPVLLSKPIRGYQAISDDALNQATTTGSPATSKEISAKQSAGKKDKAAMDAAAQRQHIDPFPLCWQPFNNVLWILTNNYYRSCSWDPLLSGGISRRISDALKEIGMLSSSGVR